MSQSRMSRSDRHKPKKKKKMSGGKKVLLTLLIIVLVLIGGVAAVLGYMYQSVSNTVNEDMHVTLNSDEAEEPKPDIAKGVAPINILLLGVDQRPGDSGRSDTMIVATLNPKTDSMLMTSIPRDTRVHIKGHNGYAKLNAAYAYGGNELAVNTIEKYLDININYVVRVNMEGLSDLVDAVGGVTVNNDIQWSDAGYTYKKGEIYLDGKHALAYARMRHDDPRGDFGRNLRQRQVIEAILGKGAQVSSVTHMKEILDALGKNVQTNLDFSDMKNIVRKYRDARQNIYSYEVVGTPKYIDGVSWVLVSDNEVAKVHQMIKEQEKGTLDFSKYKQDVRLDGQ